MSAQVQALAAEMGVTVADVEGFIAGLSVWIGKGYNLTDAIAKHGEQMLRFVNHGASLIRDQGFRTAIADGLWTDAQVSP